MSSRSNSKTVLVTGGAGFIGCNFVRTVLKETQYRLVVLDKLTYAGSPANLEEVASHDRYEFVHGDITDGALLEELFAKHSFHGVMNFAAETHVDRSIDSPGDFIETNIVGTYMLLTVAQKHYAAGGLPDFRFLHVSTDEVYGSLGPEGLFREDTPYQPNSPYSASKASADHLVRAYQETYGLPTVITNCSNNYGPFQFPEKLIPLTLLNAAEGRKLPIYGDGSNIRDWLHVEDHCHGILLAFEKGRFGEKYNIGGNNERKNIEVVDMICDALEKLYPAGGNENLKSLGVASYHDLKEFVRDRPGHDRRYAIDSSKISRELGWEPKYTFEKGLEQTVAWYLKHKDWCDTVQKGNYSRERLGTGPAAAPQKKGSS